MIIQSIEKPRQSRKTMVGAWDEEAICEFIRSRLGMEIRSHQRAGLRQTIENACNHFGLSSAGEYIRRLQNSSPTSAEREYLVSQVTVGESYFFRDENQFDFLRDTWLPTLLAKKRRLGDFSLRIWSAGCSGGQELFSLAILLDEQLDADENWNVHLLGTDINVDVLNAAVSGHYSSWSLRATAAALAAKYFEEDNDTFVLRADIRRLAKFNYLNLVDDNFPSILSGTNNLDLIICRNVFIYLPISVVRQIMARFSNCMAPGGSLLVGASDPIINDVEGLVVRREENIHLFQRSKLDEAERPSKIVHKPPPNVILSEAYMEPASWTPASETSLATKAADQPDVPGDVRMLLRDANWSAAVTAADDAMAIQGEMPIMLEFKAKALANLGNIDSALESCLRSVEMDPLATHAHFLAALIYIEQKNQELAEAALRRVLFLDRSFLEAHYQLGLLNIRAGRQKAGIKNLQAALALSEKGDADRPVHDAPGMTFGRLTNILRNEINIHGTGIE